MFLVNSDEFYKEILLLVIGGLIVHISTLVLNRHENKQESKERDKLTKHEVAKNILGYKYQLFSDSIDHNYEIMYWMNMIPAVFSDDKEVMKTYVDLMDTIKLNTDDRDNKLGNKRDELLLELLREVLLKSGMIDKKILSDEIIRVGFTLKKEEKLNFVYISNKVFR